MSQCELRTTERIFSDSDNACRHWTVRLRSILFAGKIITEFMVENVNNYSSYESWNIISEFRFESPISISKWNNSLDFRRKSENYFKVKIFSDSRPKSAQKPNLKVFSDFQTQIICRLSKIFKILILCYTCASMVFLSAGLFMGESMVSGCWDHRSFAPVLND